MFEDKKVVIWGTGKFQKDFLYIFDDIHPAYSVTDDHQFLEDGVYSCEHLMEEKDRESLLVIVCDFDQDKAGGHLEKWGFEHGKTFLYAEELFSVLDEPPELHLNGRKLAFWGAGAELGYFQSNTDLESDIYIDGDINKRNRYIDGKQVVYSGDILNWENYLDRKSVV